jgi:MFS family permease
MNTLPAIIGMFSPYIAGTILSKYGNNMGMRMLYSILTVCYLIIATIDMRFLKETREKTQTVFSLSEIPKILKDTYAGLPSLLKILSRNVKAMALIIILGFTANAVVNPFWVVYALDKIGLSPVEWGTILLLETALRTILFIPAGVLVDKYGRTKALIASLALSTISIPFFIFCEGFIEVLLIRLAIAVINAFFIPASSALMADTIPREIRGRVMAALGRGTVMIGAAGEGTGGPGLGYLIIFPLVIFSLIGGLIYAINPVYPWIFIFITTLLSLIVSAFFLRDPINAEI